MKVLAPIALLILTGCAQTPKWVGDYYNGQDLCQNFQVIDSGGFDYKEVDGRLVVTNRPPQTTQPRFCTGASSRKYIYNAQGTRLGYIK